MVTDYITDREESGHELSESCVMALLGTVDFGSISRDALKHCFIPRIEKLSPSYALVLNDFPGSSHITRCGFSMERLVPNVWYKGAVALSCGNNLSETTFTRMANKIGDNAKFPCPFCRKTIGTNHWLKRVHFRFGRSRRVEIEYYGNVDNPETEIELKFEQEPTRPFFDRKHTKSAALMHWVASRGDTEDENATSERTQKRSRSDNPVLFQSKGLFVRVLNQCSEIESEKVFFHSIGSADWRIDRTIDAFRKNFTAIPADMMNHETLGIGFFRYVPNALYSLGERLAPDAKWSDIGFNLRGGDEELIVARRRQVAG